MTMPYRNKTIANLLAAEYVIGTLGGRARRRFKRLLQEWPEVAALTQDWEHTLNQLAPLATAVTPPPETWQKINQRIEIGQYTKPNRKGGSVRFWRAIGVGNGMIALVLCMLLWLPGFLTEPAYLILVNDEQEQPVWLLNIWSYRAQLQVSNLRPVSIPPGKRCILWLQPEGSDDYYPIGILPDDGSDIAMPISDDIRSMLPGKLTVSLENITPEATQRPTQRMNYRSQWLTVRMID